MTIENIPEVILLEKETLLERYPVGINSYKNFMGKFVVFEMRLKK